ncbi:transcriptional regulator family: Fungal Specific TF [Penicillium roqueforti]|nr:transcriptional regulator family: Fungal Specific TF [Penicillium roqueforti]
MTRSQNLRVYRACQRCRQRKLKCDPSNLSEGTKPSCVQCLRSSNECMPAGSRRGGDFSRFRRPYGDRSSTPTRANIGHGLHDEQNRDDEKVMDDPIYAELTNPGDALQILAQLAANDSQVPNHPNDSTTFDPFPVTPSTKRGGTDTAFNINGPIESIQPPVLQSTLSETETLVIGVLGTDTVCRLIHHYAANYHTFCPLAPKRLLATTDPRKAAVDEPFLLTVLLTIASKDEPAYKDIHQHCWKYLKRHMLDILLATPSTLRVGSVEGLLLLSEWVPYMQLDTCSYPNMFPRNLSAVEDNMAWSLIGQAVRHSYLLRLDKASFRETALGESQELENRNLLAWIFVYIADRQISVRMGQSFWSRGPSLSTNFTANDFPTLRLRADAEHKYAHVLQATIELTQLLHNVHDTLYASKERRTQMVRRGDYNRYLDDFRHSMSAWKDRWDGLETSPKLHCTMHIFKEAAHHSRPAGENRATTSGPKRAPSLFPRGIMSTAEGAYVLEAVDAARAILTIVVQTISQAQIRYMPFRFYMYTVYSAVFLYKADVFGAVVSTEHTEVVNLVQHFIQVLEEAAISDSHIASRFASLLKRMWLPDRQCHSPKRNTSSTASNYVNTSSQQCELPRNTDLLDDGARHDLASSMQVPEPAQIPTPYFNLFYPEFSTLESELVEFGAWKAKSVTG